MTQGEMAIRISTYLKDQFVCKMANFNPVLLVPDGVEVVKDYACLGQLGFAQPDVNEWVGDVLVVDYLGQPALHVWQVPSFHDLDYQVAVQELGLAV